MEIVIEPTNFNASQDLQSTIESMMVKLEDYNDQIATAHVYLTSNKETPDHQKTVKIKVNSPRTTLFAESQELDFISAAQQSYDKMKRQVIEDNKQNKDKREPRPDKFQ
jgi:ribosomal subunit interface protein